MEHPHLIYAERNCGFLVPRSRLIRLLLAFVGWWRRCISSASRISERTRAPGAVAVGRIEWRGRRPASGRGVVASRAAGSSRLSRDPLEQPEEPNGRNAEE